MTQPIPPDEKSEASQMAERLLQPATRNLIEAAQHYLHSGDEAAAFDLYFAAVVKVASTMATHVGAARAVLTLRCCIDGIERHHRRKQH